MNPSNPVKLNGTLYIFLFAAVLIITSIPLLQIGFSSDDVLNSLIQGIVITKMTSLYEFTRHIIHNWMYAGRFFPIAFISTYYLFYLTGTQVLFFNLIHWSCNLIALGLSCLFLKNFTTKKEHILLFCLLFLMCWSSFPGSPYVAFGVLLPVVVSFIMLSLIFYMQFLNRNTLSIGFLSLFFYILALFTYEVAFVVPPLILILNKCKTGYYFKRNIHMTLGIATITLFYLGLLYYLRQWGTVYVGISMGGNLKDIFHTFYYQLVGELPLMTRTHTHDPISLSNYCLALLVFSGSSLLSFKLLARSFPIRHALPLFLMGVLLQLIPALLIGMSTGYQHRLSMGVAHIPVFIQALGFAMMVLVVTIYIQAKVDNYADKTRLILRGLVAIFIGYLFAASFLSNQVLTETWNQLTRYSRDIYETALNQKLLTDLPLNSVILKKALDGNEICWNSTEQRVQLLGRTDILLFDLNGKAPAADIIQEKEFNSKVLSALPDKLYYLDFEHLPHAPKSGFVLLAKLSDYNPQTKKSLHLTHIKLFYTAKRPEDFNAMMKQLIKKYPMQATEKLLALTPKHFPSSGYFNISEPLLVKYPTDETKT